MGSQLVILGCFAGISKDASARKEILGHESLDTLKHYARLTITDLKKTHARWSSPGSGGGLKNRVERRCCPAYSWGNGA